MIGLPLLLVLAGLSALGSLGIHAIVPALPAMAAQFAVAAGPVQLAVTVYLAALAVGQLLSGWLSDFRGRRRILIAGAALYTCGSFAAAAAPDLGTLLAARFMQGLGGACGLVVARSIIVDRAAAEDTTGHLAILATIGFASPALAPLAGGLLVEAGSWRLIFLCLGGLGLLGLIGASWIPETRDVGGPGRDRVNAGAFLVLARNAVFRRCAFINSAATIGMFVFLTASSFLLLDLYGLHGHETGIVYLLVACGVVAGALSVGRIDRRHPGRGLIIGACLYLAGASAMLACASVTDHVAALVMPMMIVGVGSGMLGPACLSGALRADPLYVGTASSLFGALQIAGGAAASAIAAALYRPSVLAIALPLFLAALPVCAFASLNRRSAAGLSERAATEDGGSG